MQAGKYVSERFRERHATDWKKSHTPQGRWEAFKESFRSEARWEKAVQHLAERGELENDLRDIGKLIKKTKSDIKTEEIDTIKNFLWREFGDEVLRKSIAGLPEWYKRKLLKRADG